MLQLSSVTDKKIELILEKEDKTMKWSKLGSPLEFHNILKSNKERELKFRKCQITSIKDVTHDTKLYAIKLPQNCYFESPVGYHTKIAANIEGIEVQRSYTIALQSFGANAITKSLQCDGIFVKFSQFATTTKIAKFSLNHIHHQSRVNGFKDCSSAAQGIYRTFTGSKRSLKSLCHQNAISEK